MAEVVMAMTVFMMMTLMFAAVVPIALKETQQSGNYNEAALLAQHKMDQLRTVNFDDLANSTKLTSDGIIDSVNTNGSYDFSSTSSDNLAAYFPTGTTGTITVATDTTAGTMSGGVYNVTITIAWPSSATSAGSFTIEDKIINY